MQKLIAALLSGILLFCSFPPFECASLAWIAVCPLIYLCFYSKPGRSFSYGFLAGIVFWLASIFWLTRVSFIGWIFISLYCSFYCALFALIISWWFGFRAGGDGKDILNNLTTLFGVPAIWVGMEYARSHFLTGFPWNILGVSQYSYGHLIQCAEWGGVYLVSYLVVMGNTAIALLVLSFREGLWKRFKQTGVALVVCLLMICLALFYGKWRLGRSSEQLETIRAAAVQSNVPQQYKWSEDWANDIYRRLKKATAEACKTAPPPDLIVWPETALPDFVRYNGPSRKLVDDSRQHGVPLLVGSMDFEERPDKTNYFNSSFLFLPSFARKPCPDAESRQGGMALLARSEASERASEGSAQASPEAPPRRAKISRGLPRGASPGEQEPRVYAKRHLVLFGEYVPFARFFPFLRSITGVEEDFMPGTENVVFRLNGVGQKFSVLICFEDTLPYLARECVRAGARLLINQTNDAWFDPSWASRQHMIHCIFRCVENRVACLRSTNTGLTCYIDRFGLIRSSLDLLGRKSREPQIMRSEVKFSPENMPLTFYTRHGDIFAVVCVAFSLPLFLGALLSFLRKRQ